MSERDNSGPQPEMELDTLLRSALDSYGDPGPDSGLTERVLARVAAEGEHKQTRRWLSWAIALPIAAGLLIAAMFFRSNPMHGPMDGSNQARVLQPPSASSNRSVLPPIPSRASDGRVKSSRVKVHPHHAVMAAKVAPLLKRAMFPTPQPLTSAEQALVDYAAHASLADRQALIETQKRMEEPLSIAVIEIHPLEPPKDGGN